MDYVDVVFDGLIQSRIAWQVKQLRVSIDNPGDFEIHLLIIARAMSEEGADASR
jgi:hypothetical protein